MQRELDRDRPELPIRLIGVNGVGHESANDLACDGRDIPWLQDTTEAGVWAAWQPAYRDVVILDGEGRVVAIYNLTQHNLGDAEAYAALRDLLIAAAGG